MTREISIAAGFIAVAPLVAFASCAFGPTGCDADQTASVRPWNGRGAGSAVIPAAVAALASSLKLRLPREPLDGGFVHDVPGRLVDCPRQPAVMVDRAIADDFEILGEMAVRRMRGVERIDHAHALHRHLLGPVDRLRIGQACRFQNGRRDIQRLLKARNLLKAMLNVAARLRLVRLTSSHRK